MSLKVIEAEIVKSQVKATIEQREADAAAARATKIEELNAAIAALDQQITAAREDFAGKDATAKVAEQEATAARTAAVQADMVVQGLVSQSKNLARELAAI